MQNAEAVGCRLVVGKPARSVSWIAAGVRGKGLAIADGFVVDVDLSKL
jgi:hypothetical protein